MAETVLTISAGQTLDQDVQLPGASVIQAVKVDNPSGACWVNFPDIGRSVAPGTNGVVIPYRLQTRRIHVTTTPPAGQQNPIAGLAATLTFSDQPLTDASGVAAPLVTNNYAQIAFSVPLPPPGTNVLQGIPFFANSITVDDPGAQWIEINIGTGQNVTIAPWTLGAVIVPPKGISFAGFTNAAPAGLTNGTAGAPAIITYTEAILTPASGVNIAQALNESNGQSLIVGNGLGGPAISAPSFTFSFTVPAGSWRISGLTLGLSAFLLTAATPPVFGYLYTVTVNGSLIFANSRGLYDNSSLPLNPPDGMAFSFPQALNVAGGATIQGTIAALGGTFSANGCTLTAIFYLTPALL